LDLNGWQHSCSLVCSKVYAYSILIRVCFYEDYFRMSLTPASVTAAVATPTFFQNHEQFWNMLRYLFTDHQGQKVWRQVSADTHRSIIEQLQVVIENTDNFDTIHSQKELLYHMYFAALMSIRRDQTVSQFHASEKTTVLTGFYHLYKLLRQLNVMPLFATVQEGLKI